MLDKKNLGLLILLLFLISVTAGIVHTSVTRGVFSKAEIPQVSTNGPVLNLAKSDQQVSVEVIFDISNSMWGQVKGVNKILSSREIMKVILKDLPENVKIGLRTFGGDGESRLEVPLGTNNREQMQQMIEKLRPSGNSPIGYAMQQAGNDLLTQEGGKYILLLTDGIDTGKIDPVAKARELKQQGIVTHVVYIRNPNGTGIEEMTRIAEEGGGHFFTIDEKDLIVPTMTLSY